MAGANADGSLTTIRALAVLERSSGGLEEQKAAITVGKLIT